MSITVRSIRTQRINLSLKRPIRMSFGEISHQHLLLVRLLDADGVEGVGEACVMGGPFWNSDTIEGVRATVQTYTAPLLQGRTFADLKDFSKSLHRIFRGNGAARNALEMAFLDLAGKKAGKRAVDILGGPRRESMPVAWTLHGGSVDESIEEGEAAIAERGHKLFKMKVGIKDSREEASFLGAIARHFEGRARILVDANQAWNYDEAGAILDRLYDAGVAVVEQPVPGHDPNAMADITRNSKVPILADEALTGPAYAGVLGSLRSASGFVIKPQRDGGIIDAMSTAEIACEAGLPCYGGTMLETSLGTAAHAAVYAAIPNLDWGCELFGPMRLDADITTEALLPANGVVRLPDAPGLGVAIDEERIRRMEIAL